MVSLQKGEISDDRKVLVQAIYETGFFDQLRFMENNFSFVALVGEYEQDCCTHETIREMISSQ